jgi:hypothetical protein
LVELLSPARNLVAVLAAGSVEGEGASIAAANALLERVRGLAARERFFHWWTAFPTVFGAGSGGFDAVIGNPPWDRIKLQEVEWFAEREPRIARQARAADRKKLITELQTKGAPLAAQYAEATERAEANARVLTKAGDYPLLGGGDVNLYSLFVERAQALADVGGLVALLTPSGIAADKGAADFFKSIATTRRLAGLFDFENKKVFFPDIHASFKFCALIFGAAKRHFERSRCAFYMHGVEELDDPGRVLNLSAQDFELVNPNTGAAPIFRTQRDAEITTRIYRDHPVLVHHGALNLATNQRSERKVWPLKYLRMFDMTNDSNLFLTHAELSRQGFAPAGLNRWRNGDGEAVPLYEGKMVQMFDHRAADVVMNMDNLKRPAQQQAVLGSAKESPDRLPSPQFFVVGSEILGLWAGEWAIAYKSITAPSNVRTMIAAIVPRCGVGNSMAMLLPVAGREANYREWAPLLLGNMCSLAFDFALRQKVQGQNLNWFMIEQAAVIAPESYEAAIGSVKIANFIREQVLALSYTAHDLAPFARDLGHVNADGSVKAPFVWNDEDRRRRLAVLDALFMHLYGINEVDAAYILDTFPIVREQDVAAFGHFRTKDDVLREMRRISQGILRVEASNAVGLNL